MSQEPNSNKSKAPEFLAACQQLEDGEVEESSTIPNSTSLNSNNTVDNTSRHAEGKYRGRENFLAITISSF